MQQRRCDTCEKKVNEHRCAVLTVMLGRVRDCFAWSDDPDWEVKVRTAVELYGGRSSLRRAAGE